MSLIRPHRFRTRSGIAGALVVAAMTVAACGSDGTTTSTTDEAADSIPTPASEAPLDGTVRLGFFPNVTHAPALVGVAEGYYASRLGSGVDFETYTFDAGTDAIEAVLSGALDLTFIGPNPAINAFAKSGGEAIRIVSGSTSGGAFLVVRPDITSVDQLRGTTLATPSLGNTQDVALRAWLADNGLETTPEGGGDVSIVPQKNATTLDAFIAGAIDGAWVPEPWATRLVDEGGGKVLVDERDLWADTGGKYVTTHLIVRTEFLRDHPDLVQAVIEATADAVAFISSDSASAQSDVIAEIAKITGKEPKADVIAKSFSNLEFTLDPIAVSLKRSAESAVEVGLLEPVDLTGIYDLRILNAVLAARGLPQVSAS